MNHPTTTKVAPLALMAALATGCVADLSAPDGDSTTSNTPGDGDGNAPGEMTPEDGAPPPDGTTGPQLYLLTHAQVENSLRALSFEVEIGEEDLQPDTVSSGFSSIGSGIASMSAVGVERVESLISDVTGRVFDDDIARTAFVGCSPQGADDPCALAFLRAFGRKAWRRPLSEGEVERLHSLTRSVADLFDGDADQGLRYATSSILQSPRFLYQIFEGQKVGGRLQLTDHELATRLSFLLLDETPSEELLDAADAGMLTTEQLPIVVDSLLATPSEIRGIDVFCEEYLQLASLEGANKSPEMFPDLDDEDLSDMKRETIAFCSSAARGADFREMIVATETRLNQNLQTFYGVDGSAGGEFVPAPLPESRTGVLTSAGLMAAHAHADRTSPTLRGRYVRQTLLCQKVPDPPDDVGFDAIEETEERAPTLRERLAQHATDPACSICHQMMDPIGFGLEHYDAIGALRSTEGGFPVDATGDLDGAPFSDGDGLSRAVIAHPAFPRCVAQQLLRKATGRMETEHDTAPLDALGSEFSSSGFSFPDLLRNIALSPAFGHLSLESE